MFLFKYVFPSIPPGLNATEQILSDQMGQVWTNFVIYGYCNTFRLSFKTDKKITQKTCIDYINSHPTPDDVDLLPDIPKWPAYNANTEYYMAIDRNWQVKVDYTQTYTVTVDELIIP